MKSLFSLLQKHVAVIFLISLLLCIYVFAIFKYDYNEYSKLRESLVEKKQMKMLKEINNILDIQKQ